MKKIFCLILMAAAPVGAEVVSRDVTWSVNGTTITATIVQPVGKGPYPGVVMVAGSGPTDRNWCSTQLPGKNCSGALVAEELAKAGFAVMRYDKSITGPNAAGNTAVLYGKLSMRTHMDEVAAAAAQLRKEPAVDGARVFALTNSEGARHALNCQSNGGCDFAGLVLEGVTGHSMGDSLRAQIAAQVAALPNAEDIMARYDKLMVAFVAGLPFVPDPELPAGINNLVANLNDPINLPFAREIMRFDNAVEAAKVNVPVLVVIGKKDVQADWQKDGGALEAAMAGNKNAKFLYPEDADHILKHEPRPRELLNNLAGLTYNAAGRVLDAEAVKGILAWLNVTADKR